MDFITGLSISTNWKDETYDSIMVIVDQLIKIVYYKPVMVTIDASRLLKVILDIVIWHHGLWDLIVSDWGLVFILKFWSSLCYFLEIK